MNIIQPKGFITNTAPLIEWEAIQGATEYQLKLTDNVTGDNVLDTVVNDTSYNVASPLALGTYQIEVKSGNNVAIEVVIVTDTIAEYTIVGRDGDVNYTNYKQLQMNIRQQARQAGATASTVLLLNASISDFLTNANDAALAQFHLDTIKQTPGFTADFVEVLSLCSQLFAVTKRISARDPQF